MLKLFIAKDSYFQVLLSFQVQYCILYLLYSHSSKHSHYISSSTLVVGPSSPFVPASVSSAFSGGSPGGFSGSSTGENLTTIITTLTNVFHQVLTSLVAVSFGWNHTSVYFLGLLLTVYLFVYQLSVPLSRIFLFQRHVTGADILQLCIEWAGDLVKSADTSLPQLMKIKVFTGMIDAVVQIGYHHLNSVTTAVATFLDTFFSLITPTQV